MPGKVYWGFRNGDVHEVRVSAAATTPTAAGYIATTVPLDPRTDLASHSDLGFMWGDQKRATPSARSACSQLALAILADALDDDHEALRLHQRFKWRAVVAFSASWTMSHDQVLAVVQGINAVESDRSIQNEVRRVEAERPPVEHDGGRGIEWDVDLKGEPIAEREQ